MTSLPPELLQKIRRIEISTRHLVAESFAGEYQSVFKGQGMEFDEVRPYTDGDDIRSIDWNVTARMGSPFVRRYKEERELTVMLLVDASASFDFGTVGRMKRELSAELAAVLSFAALSSNDRVGMLIFTDKIETLAHPQKGRSHALRLVRDLLVFEPEGRGTDIKLALDTINIALKRKTVVFMISDFLAETEDYRHSLSLTAKRHDIVAIDLSDPMEQQIPKVGLISLEDAETDQSAWIDTSSGNWRDFFKDRVERLEEAKTQMFKALGVDRVKITTAEDYAADLTAFFRERAGRHPR